MRDRLIKLLQDNSYLDVLDGEHWLLAAEQLLANGVVVIDTYVVSPENRPLISQYMGRPIDEVINLIRRSEWISVDDRLPKVAGNEYLVWDNVQATVKKRIFYRIPPSILIETYPYIREYFGNSADYKRYTHWMPLPEPPVMKGGAE